MLSLNFSHKASFLFLEFNTPRIIRPWTCYFHCQERPSLMTPCPASSSPCPHVPSGEATHWECSSPLTLCCGLLPQWIFFPEAEHYIMNTRALGYFLIVAPFPLPNTQMPAQESWSVFLSVHVVSQHPEPCLAQSRLSANIHGMAKSVKANIKFPTWDFGDGVS